MISKKIYIKIVFTSFLVIFPSLLILDLGSDYSFYFSASIFENEDFRLYKEFFTHKGPVIYFTIKAISFLSDNQGLIWYLAFLFIFLFYGISFYFTVVKRSNDQLFVVLIFIASHYNLSSNAIIQFLLSAFTFLFLFYGDRYFKNLKLKDLVGMSVFFSLALLTRIDFIIYLIPLLFFLFRKVEYSEKLKFIGVGLTFFVLIYSLFQFFYGFSHIEFWNHNMNFNFLYGGGEESLVQKIKKIIYRPELLTYLTVSGFILVLFLNFKQFMASSFFLKSSVVMAFLFLSLTGSDKNYHFMIFSSPLLFVISSFHFNETKIYLPSIVTSIILMLLMFANLIMIDFRDRKKEILSSLQFIESANYEGVILGGSGRVNLCNSLSEKIKIIPKNNSHYYNNENVFLGNQYLIDDHDDILSYKNIMIERSLYSSVGNKLLQEIIDNFEEVQSNDFFILLENNEVN
jgi:hypothetical protein